MFSGSVPNRECGFSDNATVICPMTLIGITVVYRLSESNTSVTFTLRRPYGGRRTPKSSDSCGCRRNSAVAAGPPYGESLCFTGRMGGRRIIARSYNFFHFYVRRRNLTRRSHAVDASTALRRPYIGRTEALRLPCGGGPRVILWLLGTPRSPYGPLAGALRMP